MRYYVKAANRAFGPFSLEDVRGKASRGQLTSDALVSTDKEHWRPAFEFPELGLEGESRVGAFDARESSNADAEVWFLKDEDGCVYGPLSARAIADAALERRVSTNATLWRDGEQERPLSAEPLVLELLQTSSARATDAETTSDEWGSAREWFFSNDGRVGYGPYSVNEILDFVNQGAANFDATVWRQGENARLMRREPAFARHFAETLDREPAFDAPPSVARTSARSASRDFEPLDEERRDRLNRSLNFRYYGVLISFLTTFVLRLIGAWLVLSKSSALATGCCAFLWFFSSIVAAAFLLGFIWRFWESTPSAFTTLTPARATLFLLIPGFHLYWFFVAFVNGAKNMDAALDFYAPFAPNGGRSLRRVPMAEAIALAVLTVFHLCANCLPFFEPEASVLVVVVWVAAILFLPVAPFLLISFRNAALDLNDLRESLGAGRGRVESRGATLDDLVNDRR